MADKRGLLLGDVAPRAAYHPITNVQTELPVILDGVATIEATLDYSVLTEETLSKYDLFISYVEMWGLPVAPEAVTALLTYTAKGGRLLVIHNGISLQSNSELAQLVGARFTGHPPYAPLQFRVTSDHGAAAGMSDFVMDDEPYRFETDPLADRDVFLRYEHDGQLWDAGWSRSYGLGKVVYLMPGHDAAAFANHSYRQLLAATSRWLLER